MEELVGAGGGGSFGGDGVGEGLRGGAVARWLVVEGGNNALASFDGGLLHGDRAGYTMKFVVEP